MKKIVVFIAIFIVLMSCSSDDSDWDAPIIPVSLKGIEAVNIDNSGEFPVVTNSSIKKEAYAIGIQWVVDNLPDDDDKYITGPIYEGTHKYNSIADDYQKAIKCLTEFNEDIPKNTYVSKFFKERNRAYLPADVDEGFVLLVSPSPGKHSFKVEYYENESLKFYYDTDSIMFY